jgi:hypothetical protein
MTSFDTNAATAAEIGREAGFRYIYAGNPHSVENTRTYS